MMAHLERLNDEQRRAATQRGSPLRIIAGAGTGKTATLTARFVDLVHSGDARIDEILALTYTRKAAEVMRGRILDQLDQSYSALWISTFHSFCQRALRQELPRLGLPQPQILGDDERLITLTVALEGLTLESHGGHRHDFYRQALLFIDRVKDECMTPDEARQLARRSGRQQMRDLAEAYAHYQQRLRHDQAFDFGELQLRLIEILESDAETLERWRRKFKYVLVDEYQDVNEAQARIIKLLAGDGRKLTVVGDSAQAIYAFRGASHEYLEKMDETFPDTETVVLNRNYRSHQAILDPANVLIAHNYTGENGRLPLTAAEPGPGPKPRLYCAPTELDEARNIAREIARLHWVDGVDFRQIAVLLRSVTVSGGPIAGAIRDYGMPVIFAGRDYQGARALADVIATLSLLDEETPDALNHVLASYDVDPLQIIRSRTGNEPLQEHLRHWMAEDPQAYRAVRSIRGHLEMLSDAGLPDQVYGALNVCNRLPPPDSPTFQDVAYMRAFRDVLDRATRHAERGGDRQTFLASLRREVARESSEQDTDGPAVQVMTVHAAKGLEFDYVFVAGMTDGRFPLIRRLDRGLDLQDPASWRLNDIGVTDAQKRVAFLMEERRLGYVALTRARKGLFLSYAQEHAPSPDALPTFIENITASAPETLERATPATDGRAWSTTEYARNQRELLMRSLESPELTGEALGDLLLSQWTLQHLPDADPWTAPVSPLVFTGDESIRLSYTTLKTWEECPRRYYYGNVLKLWTDEPIPQLSLGTAIHDAIEWMNKQRQQGMFPSEEELVERYLEGWSGDAFEAPAQEIQNRRRGEALLRRFYRWEVEQGREIIETEIAFDVPFGHHTLTGRIDCVARDADGNLEIIDYKSGRKNSTTKKDAIPQLAIYRLAWDTLRPGESPRTSLYFLRHNKDKGLNYEREFTFNTQSWALDLGPDDVGDVRDRLASCANGILNNEFAVTNDPKACEGCAYRLICEGAAVDG